MSNIQFCITHQILSPSGSAVSPLSSFGCLRSTSLAEIQTHYLKKMYSLVIGSSTVYSVQCTMYMCSKSWDVVHSPRSVMVNLACFCWVYYCTTNPPPSPIISSFKIAIYSPVAGITGDSLGSGYGPDFLLGKSSL